MGFRVWGLGFRVWGLGFGVWGLGFRVPGLGCREGLGSRVCMARGSECEGFGSRVRGSQMRV